MLDKTPSIYAFKYLKNILNKKDGIINSHRDINSKYFVLHNWRKVVSTFFHRIVYFMFFQTSYTILQLHRTETDTQTLVTLTAGFQ